MTLDVCFSPQIFDNYATSDSVVVVVDVLRASTSICTAFRNGAVSIRTTASLTDAKRMKAEGALVAAERDTRKCDFADFGNSPFDFTAEKVSGQTLVFTTTNGTAAVEAAKQADEIIIGAFSNISSVANYCSLAKKNIIILCAGWNNRFCLEDTLFAGALIEKMDTLAPIKSPSDAARAALSLWKVAKSDLLHYICDTEHARRMKKNGLEHEIAYCLTPDTTFILPRLNKNSGLFTAQ